GRRTPNWRCSRAPSRKLRSAAPASRRSFCGMKRKNVWRSMLVVFVLAWALWEMNPPTPRDLIEEFQARAVNTDTNFTAIVQRASELQKQSQTPGRAFASLLEAAGTNNIAR